MAAPEEALGVEVAIGRDEAEREIKKASSGFAGIGAEKIASIDLLWVPAIELQLIAQPECRRDVLEQRVDRPHPDRLEHLTAIFVRDRGVPTHESVAW